MLPLLALLSPIVTFPYFVHSAALFGRCSSSSPCDYPSVCVDDRICLPPEAPTPVFASVPFSLPLHDSPLILPLPEGLLHQNAPQRAIFLPPARTSHSPPELMPISRVYPVISGVVGETVIDGTHAASQLNSHYRPHSFRSYPPPTSLPTHTQESSELRSFSPPFSRSQLSLPTARQISIDEVMEEQLPKAKPIVTSFKSYPPPPSPSAISIDLLPPVVTPLLPLPSPIAETSYLEQAPIIKMADLRLRASAVAMRNPQALPGGECLPSTECTGGSECVNGICLCPQSLVHQGTVCVLRALYPGMFT